MTRTIDLQPADRAILQEILNKWLRQGVRVWGFGSRVTGTARRYSDLDLAVEGDERLSLDVLVCLKDALSESDLTIRVDVIDLKAVDPAFLQKIYADMVTMPRRVGGA
jgi:type I restriction enzyme S subunit